MASRNFCVSSLICILETFIAVVQKVVGHFCGPFFRGVAARVMFAVKRINFVTALYS